MLSPGMSERAQDKSLRVSTGGSMQGDLNQEVLEVGGDDIEDMAKREHQRKIWDKKKKRFTTYENLNKEQQKEIRYLRNEAGNRVRRLSSQQEKLGLPSPCYKHKPLDRMERSIRNGRTRAI